jgi:hypothetical protein
MFALLQFDVRFAAIWPMLIAVRETFLFAEKYCLFVEKLKSIIEAVSIIYGFLVSFSACFVLMKKECIVQMYIFNCSVIKICLV